jgi:hypothetical protein
VLFSNDKVAEYINKNFVPAWQSVRDVPMVTIDFGKGHVLTRTLHGNVATYVITPEGKVLDIMPGVYEAETYLNRLRQFTLLGKFATQSGLRQEELIKNFHERQAAALKSGKSREVFSQVRSPSAGASIFATERAVKIALQPAQRIATRAAIAQRPELRTRLTPPDPDSAKDLAGWKALAEDTAVNESVRRQLIHAHLAKQGLVTPKDVTKWLYREVLHADLDDPYMGLGKILFPGGVPK